jgi:tRNA (guanine37-N1)-methyltransferase
MVVADSVVRLIPGVLGSDESSESESFSEPEVLEYPQYTRPEIFRGMRVPDVLLSGDHGAIAEWRKKESLRVTSERGRRKKNS